MQSKANYNDITGVILAGGLSTRMGKDKAGLKVAGVSMFERILRVMQNFFPRIIIAGDRQDLARPGVPCYPDIYPGSALGGLYTGLIKAKTQHIFVAPCDIPHPDNDLIRLILAQREGVDVVVPKTPAGMEPLFALYCKTCLKYMQDMLERGEYRIYDFYPLVRTRYLNAEDLSLDWERSLLNVNTPEEFHSIEEKNI